MIDRIATVSGMNVSRETFSRLEQYVALLLDESERQNLIARSTMGDVWNRHILDSAQLIRFASPGSTWADIGAGGGLPGIVIAILTDCPVLLIEPRRLRAEFLSRCIDRLGLTDVLVRQAKVEHVHGQTDVITARAFAPLDRLLLLTRHLSHPWTRWVLPKGRNAATELEQAARSWQGHFRTEPSLTADDASIIVADRLTDKKRGGK